MGKAAIAWGEIYRRIEAAGKTVEGGWEASPEEKKKIMMARAKELARAPVEREKAEKIIEVVEFLLAYERYGIESTYISEVWPLKDITPLPGAPPFVAGIINVRSQILSVIDIKKFFDLPEKGLGDLNKVLILHSCGPGEGNAEEMEFGILADAIIGVRTVRPGDLQPAPPTFTGVRLEYLRGITEERVAILDAVKLLSDDEINVHKEVT
jgi:purine-binding chemotaxis protein CheW